MPRARTLTLLLALPLPLLLSAADRPVIANAASPHAKLKSVSLDEVRWTTGFWANWYKTNRDTITPVIWKALNNPANSATFLNFQYATGRATGKPARTDWNDGDVYKYLETVASLYASNPDPKLDKHMDEMIELFAAAQEPDGYISTPAKLKGFARWSDLKHHELYNMGHLLTAACIHHRATGKKNFLNVATKLADYLYTVFMPRPRALAHFGFNPSQIMGVAELYRTTGNPRYLELAGVFVDMRGSQPGGTDQNQQRVPLRKETEAVGHAVTANYLYAGAADVYAETGEPALLTAISRIWSDFSSKRVYVTGAAGNLYHGTSFRGDSVHEAYGIEYELPHRLGYNETCANIASAMWSYRMLSLTGDAQYADMMETVLYNSMLSAVGTDGQGFYYNNPLRRHGQDVPPIMRRQDPPLRAPILPCYCCPPNVSRTLAQLQGWAFSKSADTLWVNLYGASTLNTQLASGPLQLSVTTDYPWSGVISLKIEKAPATEVTLSLRVPAWAEGATLQLTAASAKSVAPGAYAPTRRVWKPGDTLRLNLPMQPRLVAASRFAESTRNQITVMRGPLVYALESPDLPAGVHVDEIAIPAGARFTPRHDPALLGGVTVLEASALRIPRPAAAAGQLYFTLRPTARQTVPIRLIPYYAWSNRGMSHMSVWLPIAW